MNAAPQRARVCAELPCAPTATTITVLSQKGGTGKTTTVRSLADVYARIGLDVLCVDLDPQGNLSDYFDVPADASPTIADVLAGQAPGRRRRSTTACCRPTSAWPRSELVLSGKMGRELTLRRALTRRQAPTRPRADRLPAVARAAHGQRARRGRPCADLERGRVLLAPGRRAGARGGGAGQGVAAPRARVARGGAQHRRHAARPRARGARAAQGPLRRQGLRTASSGARSATPSRPSAACRSSTTRPTWAPTTSRSPRSCSNGWGSRRSASGSRAAPERAGSRVRELMFKPATELAAHGPLRRGQLARARAGVARRASRRSTVRSTPSSTSTPTTPWPRPTAIGPGDERPFAGVPIAIKDWRARQRAAHDGGLGAVRRLRAAARRLRRPSHSRGGLRHRRQDEPARVRDPAGHRAAPARAHAQPLGHRPHAGRVLGRRGRRGRRGDGPDRPRLRRRRLDPHPRRLLRPRRAQEQPHAHLARARHRRRLPRPGRRAHAHGRGGRGDARPARRLRARRRQLGAAAGGAVRRGAGREPGRLRIGLTTAPPIEAEIDPAAERAVRDAAAAADRARPRGRSSRAAVEGRDGPGARLREGLLHGHRDGGLLRRHGQRARTVRGADGAALLGDLARA